MLQASPNEAYVYGDPRRRHKWMNVSSRRGIFAPTGVRGMAEPERAYIGAMLDGEGCIYWRKGKRAKVPQLTFANTDPEILSALLRAMGTGTVVHHRDRRATRPLFYVHVWRLADVWAVCKQVVLYSAKAQEALRTLTHAYGIQQ